MWRYCILIFVLVSDRSSVAQVCPDNQYNENQQSDSSTCVAWGHYNIKTFDEHGVNFEGKCSFTMTTFKLADGSEFKIDIGVANNCAGTNCPTLTTITYKNKKYTAYLDEAGLATFSSGGISYSIPKTLNGEITINLVHKRIVVNFISAGVLVKWNKKDMIEVTIDNQKNYTPLGLCGNNDRCSTNDQRLKNNQVTGNLLEFLEEWQTDKGTCSYSIETESSCDPQKLVEATQTCNVLRTNRFEKAHEVLNPEPFVDACIRSYCSCQSAEPTSCLCDTYEAYATAAKDAGARDVPWRQFQGVELCPYECPGDLPYYSCDALVGSQPCGSDAPVDPNKKCEEGCFCNKNMYLFGDACYTKANCRCSFEGETILPGKTVTKNGETCTCTNGKIDCPKEDPDIGGVIGDPHFTTWDGRKYDFMGKCAYYLVNANRFTIVSDHYILKNGQYVKEHSNGPSYMRRILIEMDGQIVDLKPNLEVAVNNVPVKHFPHWAETILITKISASALLVELPNGVEIQWDGIWTGIFRAPVSLQGKLRGLLGTYTDDPSDDFSLPDGTEVTNANVFGNSWKTEYSCLDEPSTPIQHPCDANPAVKPQAESICSVIKGNIFQPCGIADVQTYYENCIFDACYCVDDLDACACGLIAMAAEECVRKGIAVNWRAQVPQCAVTCPAGQVYQECGNSCGRTCEDLSLRPHCESKCVEGCNCPPGTALDEANNCVAVEECKCKLKDALFAPGFQILNTLTELLTCTAGRWIQTVPTHSEQNNVPTEDDLNNRCTQLEFSKYAGCKRSVPETCENMHDYEIVSTQECEEGCECVNGYILNTASGTCVLPEACPCLDDGRSYTEGTVIEKEDNERCVCSDGDWVCSIVTPGCDEGDVKNNDDGKCVCENNTWKCVPSQCLIWGDSHVKRFDGTRLDFQGECSYILAQGILNGSGFSIRLDNEICSHTGATCLKSVRVSVALNQVEESITLAKHGILPNTENYEKIKVTDKYLFVEVEIVDIGIKLFWDLNTWVSLRVDDAEWRPNVQGLCEKYDKLHENMPVSTTEEVLNFVDTWRLDSECPKSVPSENVCDEDRHSWAVTECEKLKSPLFSPCHSKVPVEDYYEVCVSDSCKCDIGGDCECLCTAIKAYAQRCNDFGISIEWRSQKRCPVQCSDNTRYEACMSVCPPRTCDTLDQEECEDQFCTEGCAPPPLSPGYVYLDDNYWVVVDERNCGNTENPGTVPPPEECDPSKCPALACPPDTIPMQIEGQCCESCQHEAMCVIETENGDVILKEPGDTWMEGFCRQCTCAGNEEHNYCAQCKNKECIDLGGGDRITEDTYYQLMTGTCCSKLEPVACVYQDRIYVAGMIWSVEECLSMQCVIDPQSQMPTMVEIHPECQQTCPVGFKYKEPDNGCCGSCVQDSCVFDGTARRVGEEWYAEDGCLAYRCHIVGGQYQVYSYKTACPAILHCSGNIRRGRCCEYCDTFEIFTWTNEPPRCSHIAA